ncbi:MAG: TIGR02281 family clan AA aspartic protease [Rhodospirillales bacterium]
MRMTPTRWLWLGLIGAAVLTLVAWLHDRYPDTLSSRDGQISLVHSVLILAFVASSLVVRGRPNVGRVVRDATLWIAIGGLILIGYSFRHDAAWLGNRLLGEINPSAGMAEADSIRFRASKDGHYSIDALVDGEPVRFLVDTGASDVVLSPADARRLGFSPDTMSFTKIYSTANGTVRGAPVRLGRIQVGPILVEDVRASVNGADLGRSLLGMSFLERIGGFDVRNDTLTLYR